MKSDCLSRKLLIIPPLALGVLAVALAVIFRQSREQSEPAEMARRLSVAPLDRVEVRPTAVGYGVARPARIWRAVAEVGGTVVETHPRLDAGEFIAAGTVVVRIDPVDYELQVAQLEAEQRALEARIREVERTRENDLEMFKIQEESLEVARREFQRLEKLNAKRAASRTNVDQQQRTVLQQQQLVQSLRNSLNLDDAAMARQLRPPLSGLTGAGDSGGERAVRDRGSFRSREPE